MEQQAELVLADLPVAPVPLHAVAPLHVPTIRTLFPAVHHVQVDRSALGRALALWAATRRAAELSRRHTADHLWARRWSRRAGHAEGTGKVDGLTRNGKVGGGLGLTWTFGGGADDGNRTRILSLGISVSLRDQAADLAIRPAVVCRR